MERDRSSHENRIGKEHCDGQGLPSPGRWEPQFRRRPESDRWATIPRIFIHAHDTQASVKELSELALDRLEGSPVSTELVNEVKAAVTPLNRTPMDRAERPIDSRLMDAMTRGSSEPQVAVHQEQEMVDTGAAVQQEVDEELASKGLWNRNYASVLSLADKVQEVLQDQSRKGQLWVLEESRARLRFLGLVVASVGASGKEKAGECFLMARMATTRTQLLA